MKLSNLLYNPSAQKDIGALVKEAHDKGYLVRRRGFPRRWFGRGSLDIPPFVEPLEGYKGTGEVSGIYATIHELDPNNGHLAHYEEHGLDVYKNVRKFELDASKAALKRIPEYGLLTDPVGLINLAINWLIFAVGLGKLQYKLRYRSQFAQLNKTSD